MRAAAELAFSIPISGDVPSTLSLPDRGRAAIIYAFIPALRGRRCRADRPMRSSINLRPCATTCVRCSSGSKHSPESPRPCRRHRLHSGERFRSRTGAVAISAASAEQRQALAFVNVTIKDDGYFAGPTCHPSPKGYAAIAADVAGIAQPLLSRASPQDHDAVGGK